MATKERPYFNNTTTDSLPVKDGSSKEDIKNQLKITLFVCFWGKERRKEK